MSGYLARLKSSNSGKRLPSELQKVKKAPSYSYCSGEGGYISENAPLNPDPPQSANAELARLVARICRAYDFLDAEIKEAINRALRDHEAAEVSYRALTHKMGMRLHDDRRFCFECSELRGSFCKAAKRGEIPGAAINYEPMPYMPKQCHRFKEN